jgi:hypothetical protein
MTPNKHLANRFMKWRFFSALPGLMLAHAALATGPLYQNDAVLNYTVPGNPPPNIDATNFVNNNWFSVVFSTYTFGTEFYEPWNTVNYTNNGFMSVDSGYPLVSPGFQFDTLTTNVMPHRMAGSFYNDGTISCGALASSSFLFSAGQLIVWATNIANPGTIVMGPNTVMHLTGGNVDLSRSTITMEGFGIFNSPVALGADWGAGTDTNADWVPGADLTPTNARSSLFLTAKSPVLVNDVYLNNSTPYFHVSGIGTSNIITWAIFLEDQSLPNVTHNVYFSGTTPLAIGGGFDTIEWIGAYVDSATGTALTNYLYLNDRTELTTNMLISAAGVPVNFTFTATNAPVFIGSPAPSSFLSGVYGNTVVTNFYSYVNAQFISTTTATNASPSNPSGALTNLPDRIYITASRELDLTLAQITGADYLSLMATNLNQFDGSAGAVIVAPYSDINLGVTNGFLTASNVLKAALPNWSGSVQAWSGRWVFVGTNGVTNDFRVLLVSSRVLPTTLSQVQHLTLHGTNSVVISDAFNILSTLSIDAQNLTLTTNGYGNGATSPEGELNLESTAILWPSSLPNVRNLTNNGAIRSQNLIAFGSPPPANYLTFINHGLISDLGATIYANYFENGGTFANNSLGSFNLQSSNTVLINGSITAGGDVSITTGSLVTSNLMLQAGRSLTLRATNLLTDTGAVNGHVWSVGASSLAGLNLPIKPLVGDLLGTTIFMTAPPPNKQVINTWAGQDYGVSTAGYTNNAAIGKLILDALGTSSSFQFNGTGVSNAIYVDDLELHDYAAVFDGTHVNALAFNANLVIYYANATIADGTSVAEKLNHLNGNHLRWVPMYTGYFSSTYIVYTNADGTITTNGPFNAGLAQSTTIDSNGNGIPNGSDPTPFFVSGEVNLKLMLNNPPLTARLTWDSIPSATNTVYDRTNLVLGNWLPLTTNISSSLVPPAGGWPITNTITIAVTNNPSVPHFYRVRVDPNTTLLYGP